MQLEAALVIRICQDKERVLHDTEEVLLEERVSHRDVRSSEVVDDLQAHFVEWNKTRVRDYDWMKHSQFNPVSAMSRMVCLIAQMMLSINSLNWGGGIVKSAKIGSTV